MSNNSYECYWPLIGEGWNLPCWQMAVAFAVLLAVLYLFARYRRNHRPLRVIQDDDGEAFVAIGALQDLIHLVCEKVGTAGKPRIVFNSRGDQLNLLIRLKLYEDQQLESLRQQLRQQIIETFRESHGIQVGEVNVLITGFKKRSGGHPPTDPPGNA